MIEVEERNGAAIANRAVRSVCESGIRIPFGSVLSLPAARPTSPLKVSVLASRLQGIYWARGEWLPIDCAMVLARGIADVSESNIPSNKALHLFSGCGRVFT